MTGYLVPAGYGEAEYVDKKSRFIGRVWRIADEAEALAHIAEVRKRHADATHNVYAYIVKNGGIMRFSDDGEPGGTAGMPTLNVLRAQRIEDVCCVVTRYFGGILLGSGGLVRAYSKAAAAALEAAGTAEMQLWREVAVRCDYALFERVRRLAEQWECGEITADFAAEVTVRALCREDRCDGFAAAVREKSNGAAETRFAGERYSPAAVQKGRATN